MTASLDRRLPSVSDMEALARKRIPGFALDYLQGGVGEERLLAENKAALDRIRLEPRYLVEETFRPITETTLFGRTYALPFGAAPIGMSGMIWPKASSMIADVLSQRGLPVGLSTYATESIEEIAPLAGQNLWFQLYCANQAAMEDDLVDRAAAAGASALVVTVDIPTPPRRRREMRNNLTVPLTITPRMIRQVVMHPFWAWATLRNGVPTFPSLEKYMPSNRPVVEAAAELLSTLDGHVTIDKLKRFRDRWPRALIVKGVLSTTDAEICRSIGVDGVYLSNHGGRQLDALPTLPEVLPRIREALGNEIPILADGGVRSGLDVARMRALGADFVMLGRPFIYAAACAGRAGVAHLVDILESELVQTLSQLGCRNIDRLPDHAM